MFHQETKPCQAFIYWIEFNDFCRTHQHPISTRNKAEQQSSSPCFSPCWIGPKTKAKHNISTVYMMHPHLHPGRHTGASRLQHVMAPLVAFQDSLVKQAKTPSSARCIDMFTVPMAIRTVTLQLGFNGVWTHQHTSALWIQLTVALVFSHWWKRYTILSKFYVPYGQKLFRIIL